jgi:hypothetical protein
MENVNGYIFFLNSQISYHENQIGWALDDQIKKNRHATIVENLRSLRNFLLDLVMPKDATATTKPKNDNGPNVNNNPSTTPLKTKNDHLSKANTTSSFTDHTDLYGVLKKGNKDTTKTPATTKTEPTSATKKEFRYSDEFIAKQPLKKQQDYKLLNVIINKDEVVNYDDIVRELYDAYELAIDRPELSRSLNRLVNENKIDRKSKGTFQARHV